MTKCRRPSHRITVPALCLMLGLGLFCPHFAAATDMPVSGGRGGDYFRAECAKGSYLVGLAGSAGSWVDRIAPVCALWLRGSQTFGTPLVGHSFGASGGGQQHQATCWGSGPNNSVVQSWHIETLKSDTRFVQYIGAACMSLKPSPVLTSAPFFEFGSRPMGDERLSPGPYISDRAYSQSCPASEIALGIHGRAGLFLDAIGLICGPLPAGLGAPVTKLPGPLVQAPPPARPLSPQTKNMMIPDDMFVITKPAPGDRVPQGQLVITATAPKVGGTDITELELRYLDAPQTQRDSYPYVTVFSVNTVVITQGYPVAPIVTGGYAGRWQVRARSSMKATPGPWSLPVQFQMMKAQPPPPMVQMQRPNLPVTQAPPHGASIAPSMARPPATSSQGGAADSLFVRPRGVEEEAVKGKDQAGNPPAESQDKPK